MKHFTVEHTLQRPKSLRDKLQELLRKVELSSTFRATCLAMILAVAGYCMSHCEMFRATCATTMMPKHCETSRNSTLKLFFDLELTKCFYGF